MSLRQESGRDDDLLTRYVLGLLSEEDSEQIDEASITDDEVAARLRTVENDLIDGYVRGTLGQETLKRFESYYLSSRRRRESVRFAAGFVRAVDRASARADPTTAAVPISRSGGGRDEETAPAKPSSYAWMVRRSKVIMTLAAVAALLLVACAALLFEAVRTRNQLQAAQTERAALDRRAQELERQLDAQRASSAATARDQPRAPESVSAAASPAGGGDRSGGARAAPAIALVLLPQTRAISAIPTIVIPPGANRVAMELRLDSNDFSRYQIGLQDPATNGIVWRSAWIAAKSSAGVASVSVVVPASVLKIQHYSLQLSGRGPAGRDEVVGSYVFQVMPR